MATYTDFDGGAGLALEAMRRQWFTRGVTDAQWCSFLRALVARCQQEITALGG